MTKKRTVRKRKLAKSTLLAGRYADQLHTDDGGWMPAFAAFLAGYRAGKREKP